MAYRFCRRGCRPSFALQAHGWCRGRSGPCHLGGGWRHHLGVVVGTAGSSPEAEVLYRLYAQDLTRFATGLVGPWDAQDVVSEAMLRCLGSAGLAAAVDSRAYLYKAVLNQARQTVRASQRRFRRERTVAVRESRPSAGGMDLRPEVWAAVRSLSVRQRAVIVLTYWEDLTVDQTARRLGLSEGSVKRHLSRARDHLRRSLTL